jgi:hypothetical protein
LPMRCNALAETKRIVRPKGNLRCLLFRLAHPPPLRIEGLSFARCSQGNATPSARALLLQVITIRPHYIT